MEKKYLVSQRMSWDLSQLEIIYDFVKEMPGPCPKTYLPDLCTGNTIYLSNDFKSETHI